MSQRWDTILAQAERYYTARLEAHGATTQGVDWNSPDSQELRFDQLLRLVETDAEPFSLNDFGCGYGALVDHLRSRGLKPRYHGFDISPAMIQEARQRHDGQTECRFSTAPEELERATYSVASGVFNVRQETDDEEWRSYLFDCLDQLHSLSVRGFGFNLLTLDSDPERREAHLFYADPLAILKHCRQRYSRWVALLQDYGLWEFTILVRRDENGKWPD